MPLLMSGYFIAALQKIETKKPLDYKAPLLLDEYKKDLQSPNTLPIVTQPIIFLAENLTFAPCFSCLSPEIAGKEIKYQVTSQDIRRELGISTFGEGTLQLATISRKCEKCGNDEFEYTRKQASISYEVSR
ncbi:hypothetical protein SAY86_011016 [Trapa natans]|uniref:Uncharacterized protein n=1 Tax=Trapa natans TaxID=22666 RepID=A0AAN7LFQ0_TRANT|nr:hypothetical protein SAY86_011016 [Trapa natans]